MKWWMVCWCLFSIQVYAIEKVIAIQYVSRPYAVVHENPSRYSIAQTSVACGFPVKIVGDVSVKEEREWYYVQAGEFKGYIQGEHLAQVRGECLQEKYPKFFSQLNLDLNELYHYGKLFDQMNPVKPKVQ